MQKIIEMGCFITDRLLMNDAGNVVRWKSRQIEGSEMRRWFARRSTSAERGHEDGRPRKRTPPEQRSFRESKRLAGHADVDPVRRVDKTG